MTIRNPFALHRPLPAAHVAVCVHCRRVYDRTRSCLCAKARAVRAALPIDELIFIED